MGCLSNMETFQAVAIILAGGSHPVTIEMYVRELPQDSLESRQGNHRNLYPSDRSKTEM